MNIKKYSNFQEELFSKTLDNGLKVNILPKKGYHKTYAVLTTNFGSMDESFELNGEHIQIPAGAAHFLEHKLFEKEHYDAFELFNKNGADSNAFTSHSKTCYLFSATTAVHDNLDILLNFVQEPYFSTASVQKEQGIIGQEIQMYQDSVDWQLYMGMLKNLFPNQTMSQDIAGSIASIATITPELLYKIHQVFYRPDNLELFVVGNVNPTEVLAWVEQNQAQKDFKQDFSFKVSAPKVKHEVIAATKKQAVVNRPKLMLGINNNQFLPEPGIKRLRYLIALDLAFYLLLSSSSATYLSLYDQGLLDDTFGYSINNEREALFLTIGGDSNNVALLEQKIKTILHQGLVEDDHLMNDFTLAKKEMLGRCIAKMNSLEAIANSFEGQYYGNTTIFDEAALYEQITLDEVRDNFKNFINNQTISTYQILPK